MIGKVGIRAGSRRPYGRVLLENGVESGPAPRSPVRRPWGGSGQHLGSRLLRQPDPDVENVQLSSSSLHPGARAGPAGRRSGTHGRPVWFPGHSGGDPQEVHFGGQKYSHFEYTFWVTFGSVFGTLPHHPQYSRSRRGGCFLVTLWGTCSRCFGHQKREAVIKFIGQRHPNWGPKQHPSGDTFREVLACPAPSGDPLPRHLFWTLVGHRF